MTGSSRDRRHASAKHEEDDHAAHRDVEPDGQRHPGDRAVLHEGALPRKVKGGESHGDNAHGKHDVAREDDEVYRAEGSSALELRVAMDEVVREIPDEKKARRRERGHLAISGKLDRLAPDGHPARHEQAGRERVQARVDSGHEAQIEASPSGSAADDQDVEEEGYGAHRDYGVEDVEGPVRRRLRASGAFHARLIPRRRWGERGREPTAEAATWSASARRERRPSPACRRTCDPDAW